MTRLRRADLDARFPGRLLATVLAGILEGVSGMLPD
jgi:hypothetical protein